VAFTDEELDSASQLVKGHMLVEVPGLEDRAQTAPEPMRPPHPRGMIDYITAPCNRECVIFKQRRHIKQAHRVLLSLDPVRGARMKASAGHCRLDSSFCSASTVVAVVSLDRLGFGNMDEASEGVFYVRPLSIASVSPSDTQDYKPLFSRRYARVVTPPCRTRLCAALEQT
jgi:hypothetical protein